MQKMHLQIGKKYRTTRGNTVEIVANIGGDYPWVGVYRFYDGSRLLIEINDEGLSDGGFYQLEEELPSELAVKLYLVKCKLDSSFHCLLDDPRPLGPAHELVGVKEVTIVEGEGLGDQEAANSPDAEERSFARS